MGDGELNDRKVSMGVVVSSVLWALVVLSLLASWLIYDTQLADRLGQTGLAISAAAATATIRCYFCSHSKLIRAAFELGQQQPPKDVRSVR